MATTYGDRSMADFEREVKRWSTAICNELEDVAATQGGAGRVQVTADSDDDQVLFAVVARRLFDECGVLAVHAVQTSPLTYEVGPRAIDLWGPAVQAAIDNADGDEVAIDTYDIYEQTAPDWRNLLRLYPLSMTPEEEILLALTVQDIAADNGLSWDVISPHRLHLFPAGHHTSHDRLLGVSGQEDLCPAI